jgi:ankyrin repeat protein
MYQVPVLDEEYYEREGVFGLIILTTLPIAFLLLCEYAMRYLNVDENGFQFNRLNEALMDGDKDNAVDLLEDGDDPNEVDDNGCNALHCAAFTGSHLVERIIPMIEEVNSVNNINGTALAEAARTNHLNIVIMLMNHPGIDLNVQGGHDNYTALHWAVDQNHPVIVAQLLSDDRIDCNLKDSLQNATPLEHAIVHGYGECEKILIVHILNKYAGVDGKPPINAALNANDAEAIWVLLEHDANNVHILNKYIGWPHGAGYTALHWTAIKECSSPIFQRLVASIHDVNAVDNRGNTTLMLAAWLNRLDVVISLMNHPGIDLNVQDSGHDVTALHLAAINNHHTIVSQLLRGDKIDTSLKDNYNYTPLRQAIFQGSDECVKILNVHILNKYAGVDGKPPLVTALDTEDDDAIWVLLEHDADPNEVDEYGQNALHHAAWKGCRPPLFQRVVARIHDVNTVDNGGNTALMWAAGNNQLGVVISLMNHPGIDLNVQDRINNYTALHHAVYHNHPAIVSQLLSDDKMDASLKDGYNRTALKHAIVHGYGECEKILRDHGAQKE